MKKKTLCACLLFCFLPFLVFACNTSANISSTSTSLTSSKIEKTTQPLTPEYQKSTPQVQSEMTTPTFSSSTFGQNKLILEVKDSLGTFSIAPDGSVWIHISSEAGSDELWRYKNGQLIKKIFLFDPGKLDGIQDFKVTDKEIWILDLANWRPTEQRKVVRLGLDGTIQAGFPIPNKLFIGQDGEYNGMGVDHLLVGPGGDVLLEGTSGLYRFFNSKEQIDPKRLEGYTYNSSLYRIITPGNVSQPCEIQIGDLSFEIDNDGISWCQKIIGIGKDGSFYLLLGNITEQKNSILHMDTAGKVLEEATIYYDASTGFPPAFPTNYEVSADGQVYAMIYQATDNLWLLIKLSFSQAGSTP